VPAPTKAIDRRINMTLQLEPEILEELKVIAARKRTKVNTLVLEGVQHVIRLNAPKTTA
jgi:hypothetical protein